MKKFRELSEAIKDKYDIGEYDQEGDMAKSDLRSIIANSKRVHDMLKDDDNLPEWVQSKITKAEDYMSTVANYLESEMNEEAGASKKQETTFHKKLDTLVHKTFGKRKEEMKEAKETGFEKTFRKNTGETYDQYANRRAKEEDERQEQMRKQKEDYIKQGIIKAESVELDEALRHEIAGQVGRFIGNKIDPVHGDIMHAHGKEAYRQAAYHIRKTVNDVKDAVSSLHDRLHKQLRTGGLATEEVELDEGSKPTLDNILSKGEQINDRIKKHIDAADFHRAQARKVDKKDPNDIEGYNKHASLTDLHMKASWSLRNQKKSPNGNHLNDYTATHKKIQSRYKKEPQLTREEVEELDEISAEVSKRVAQARDRSAVANKLTSTQSKRLKMGDKGGDPDMNAAKALKSAMKRGAKNVYDEEVELDEGKYGAFRTGPKRPKYPYVPQGDKDPRTGLPLGFSHPPKKVKEEVELEEGLKSKLAAAGIAAAMAASPMAHARVTPGGQSAAQHMSQSVSHGQLPSKETKSSAEFSKEYLEKVASGKHPRPLITKDHANKLLKKHYSEEVESLEEKNVPTSPEKWARAKAQAKAKFDVYPSAYANGWAAKKYKEMGGGWKSVSEETDLDEGYFKNQEIERQETERLAKRNELPFTPDKPKKRSVVVGKKPEGYSRVRQLARQAIPKPVKEAKEMSKKAKIVKDAMKKSPDDKFQANPELSNSVTRNL